MSQRRHTPELQDEAVRQVLERGHSVTAVAEQLGVSAHSRHKWVKAMRARTGLSRVFAETGIPGQVTGTGSLFKLHLHDAPITTLHDTFPKPGMPSIDELRVALINQGFFMGSNCLGTLSTATTEAHVDGLCEALRAVLPGVAAAA